MSSLDLFAPSAETRRLSVKLDAAALEKIGMNKTESADFLRLRGRFLDKPLMEWERVKPLPDDFCRSVDDLPEPNPEKVKELLSKLVFVQLNGGLGTAMGLRSTKSSLQLLKQGGNAYSLLDCKILQLEKLNQDHDVDIPLVLMNSPKTHDETLEIIKKYPGEGKGRVSIHTFVQSEHPLMHKDTLAPVAKSKDERQFWIPPGSGEVFQGLMRSGLLEKFRSQGKEFLFISNIENMGATIDLRLLNNIYSEQVDFQLELTNRLSTDHHGGVPMSYKEGRVHVMEISQVPFEFHKNFTVSRFKWWNTNNMWVRINNIWNMLKLQALDLDFIVKYRISGGRNVAQIETPAAMSIHSFKRAVGITVPRSRYRPINSTAQLLASQSNIFTFEDGNLQMNPMRVPATDPLIKLGDHFTSVDEYERRFKDIPNILELDHLTVSGDVIFGSKMTLKGTVIIVAEHGEKIELPDGTKLENKIVSGSLQLKEN
ncbi:UDP-glucose pyrophosphorylase [Planoprotostelium fungivorum]|uniref:UTP--glucose-1-phosphate uridylyltransferase n=1 Tax=Planoprotostelium fungivorum TaxID=1890364 RepID=A0A2P6NYL0_9EUKA|nr:UDP-glucose pyrophosphorylase [Planoprotostelium fungivorum]